MGRKRTDLVQLTLRLREDLRRKLAREADKRDHSLNNEIVRLIERAFEYERAFGNERTQVLLRFIAAALSMIDDGERWNENPKVIERVIRLIGHAADYAGTKPDERPDDARLEALKKDVGQPANAIVEMVTGDRELFKLSEHDVGGELRGKHVGG